MGPQPKITPHRQSNLTKSFFQSILSPTLLPAWEGSDTRQIAEPDGTPLSNEACAPPGETQLEIKYNDINKSEHLPVAEERTGRVATPIGKRKRAEDDWVDEGMKALLVSGYLLSFIFYAKVCDRKKPTGL